jgi:glutamate/tyrosine decarboxylase-like PLP-dependent enzyme
MMKEITPYMFEKESLSLLSRALDKLGEGFSDLPGIDGTGEDRGSMERVLFDVAERLQDNYPYFHPLYAGQMLKPPHPVARTAYALAMWINPNNHALDGGRASSAMEKEATADLARMIGWDVHLGHLCSAGTTANLEALWISGCLHPGATILASSQAHYTHERLSRVLKLDFEPIPCDRRGRLDLDALEKRLRQGGVGTVVATIGTTAIGAVDPLPGLLELRARYGFRIHADAAYGGYFTLADNLTSETRAAYDLLKEVDSLVIDPHKHGLQPYGCGCVLFREPGVGRFYKHDSPYTYFSSKELHLGEISLECSRPGAAAVALWATHRLLPLVRGGEFSVNMGKSRNAALALYKRLEADGRVIVPFAPELDIIFWALRAPRVSIASDMARGVFDEAAKRNLHLALAELPVAFFDMEGAGIERDREMVTCVRSVLMKPDHLAWVEPIWEILDKATNEAVKAFR